MPKTLFNFWKGPKDHDEDKRIDIEPLVKALHIRAAMLEDVDLFMVSFRHKKAKFTDPDQPTLVIGRISSLYFSDADDAYQVSFMGKPPEALDEESAFLIWSTAGFRSFKKHGEYSYSKGMLNLFDVPNVIRSALTAMIEIYGMNQDWVIQVGGDPLTRAEVQKQHIPGNRGQLDFCFADFRQLDRPH